MSATDRLRAALPGRRRRNATLPTAPPKQATAASTSLREERLRLVSDYIGDYPEDETERTLCNKSFHPLSDEAPKRPAG